MIILNLLKRVGSFYIDGFRRMPEWGVKVWIVILLKLFIMFAILRLLLFPDFLNKNFKTDAERGRYVLEELTK